MFSGSTRCPQSTDVVKKMHIKISIIPRLPYNKSKFSKILPVFCVTYYQGKKFVNVVFKTCPLIIISNTILIFV